MDCLTYSKTKYYSQTDSKRILHEFNNIFNTNIDNLSQEMLCIFYDCIYVEPICYLNKNVYTHTFTELESIYENNKDTISITEKMIEHFFIGYKTFQNITMIINDLEKANFSDELKNQLFRFPTYISILENCLSNLFRFIILLLDQTTIKDLSSQNKLGSLCDILNKHNFDLLTNDVNVDIRNSINHGNVICGANGISSIINFNYTKGNKPYTITLKSYEFDKIITKTYDTTSAILLGISTFINNHMGLLKVNRNEKLSIPFQLLGMSISIPEIRCVWIGGLENNKQLNIQVYIKNTDRTFIMKTSLLLAVIVFSQYNDYEQYMISFSNERLAPTWIRFKNIEVKNMFNSIVPFDKTIDQVIKRSDYLIWDASTEDIDLQEVKYFRFPNHSENNYKINNVADASNEDRKRLKAHLFIGDINDKDEILSVIKKSIEWLKCVKNPPSPTLLQKHGTMEADSLYINVYKNDGRGDKELFPQNDNFVCMVDYNIDGETTLEHGGIIQNIWSQLHHEKIDKIQIAWRESKYIIRKIKKIGANDLCPCGSGKKYKRCCRV